MGIEPIASSPVQGQRRMLDAVCCLFRRRIAAPSAGTLVAFFFTIVSAASVAASESTSSFLAYAEKEFRQAEHRYFADTNSPETAWRFARACFDRAEFATNKTERAGLAENGIAVSKQLIARHPEMVQGHYCLAMNYGQLARTKTLGALRLVDLMETEFTTAATLDEHFDFAGPDRNLGLLYLEAPSFGSIGSRSKARQHLQLALQLAPDYPENRLNLIEAYLKWNDRRNASRELKILEASLDEAHQKFSGEAWAASWFDWDNRFKEAKEQLERLNKQLETPRHAE